MNTASLIKALFLIAALYDGVIGAAFLIAPAWVFRLAAVTPPNHWAYVQFPAALLVIFGTMFAAIAAKPIENCKLIPYGIMLKAAYCGVTFRYWNAEGIPGLWKPFAVIDLVMGLLFVWAFTQLGARSTKAP
ncbi:MAG: hypothetical protein ACLQIB_21260 [Isosphaeraceae bacterium]